MRLDERMDAVCAHCGTIHDADTMVMDSSGLTCVDCAREIELDDDSKMESECCPGGCKRCLPDA